MGFIGTAKVGTDAFGQLVRREDPSRFDDLAFGMNPLGFDRVEPGTLRRQVEGQNPHACSRLLDLAVVLPDPAADLLADMPGGGIPDQQPVPPPLLSQPLRTPVQELGGDGTHRPPGDEAQRDLRAIRLLEGAGLPQHPITGQRPGVGIRRSPGLLDQAHGLLGALPGGGGGQGVATPPHLVDKSHRPARLLAGVGDQALSGLFLRRTADRGW